MKTVLLICILFLGLKTSLATSIPEKDFKLGFLNASSGAECFTYSKYFKGIHFQASGLPMFAAKYRIYNNLGLSSQITLSQTNNGSFYTYSGIQHVESYLDTRSYFNLVAGLGFKTKVNQVLEVVFQGGYNTLNVLKADRSKIFNSEMGIYFHF